MKRHLGIIAASLVICLLLIISSCMKMENASDGDWIKVNLDLQRSQSTVVDINQSVVNDDGNYTYPSILIIAVKGTISAVDIATDLSDNYGQMLLSSDDTVSYTLPVVDSVRLVRAHFVNEPTLPEILAGSLTPISIGISEPFTLDANTARKSVQIVMPSMSFNLAKGNYVKGVYKVSLTGAMAFDRNYWGWRDSGYLEDSDYDLNLYASRNHLFFLENNNKTISWIKTIVHPLFPHYAGDFYEASTRAFSDGSFAGKMTSTGSTMPVRATEGTTKTVDVDGDLATAGDDNYDQSVIEYDSSTGFPTSATYTNIDSATGEPYTGTVTEECGGISMTGYISTRTFSQRTGSDFSSVTYDGYTAKDVNGNTQCVYKKTWSGTNTLTASNFTETKATYDSDGSTLLAWMSPLEGVTGAARWEKTVVLSGNVATETQKWYDVSGNEFYRTVIVHTLTNIPLRHRSATSPKGFNVSSGIATLDYQDEYTYTNNFQVSTTTYTVTGGVASADITTTYTRDAQGRVLTGLVTNVSSTILAERTDAFDANGRRTGNREFEYINGQKAAACADYFFYLGQNWDLSYGTDSSGNRTYTITSYCNGISGGTPGTYQETPYFRAVRTYNTMGQLIDDKTYLDIDSSGNLTYVSRKSYTFDTNGALTKIQYYTVDLVAGTDTATYYIVYEYDSNLFRTAEKYYDEDGDLSTCADEDSCTINKAGYKCTAGNACYQQSAYTYY